jgi:hypothetical protein
MDVVVVTGARPASPEVSYSRKLPTNATMRMIQMYFAALRIDCSTGRDSFGREKRANGKAHAPPWRQACAAESGNLASAFS